MTNKVIVQKGGSGPKANGPRPKDADSLGPSVHFLGLPPNLAPWAPGPGPVEFPAMPRSAHQVSRLEGFSDAVFGFALTLLVVSLETPKSSDQLYEQMLGFIPFALMFAMVCWIWYEHNVFFRRYGLQDPWTVFLNCVLLFVVLFYVYPLRFLTLQLAGEFRGLKNMQGMDGRLVMLLYSAGVVLIFGVFVALHRHAWKKRADLDLDAMELLTLRFSTRAHLISMMFGVVSIAIVLINKRWAGIAGMIYALMGPLHAWNGFTGARAHERLTHAQR